MDVPSTRAEVAIIRIPDHQTMRQFVPMTDDVLYRRDLFPGPLVPYQCGLPCWHGLREETGENAIAQSRESVAVAVEIVALSA